MCSSAGCTPVHKSNPHPASAAEKRHRMQLQTRSSSAQTLSRLKSGSSFILHCRSTTPQAVKLCFRDSSFRTCAPQFQSLLFSCCVWSQNQICLYITMSWIFVQMCRWMKCLKGALFALFCSIIRHQCSICGPPWQRTGRYFHLPQEGWETFVGIRAVTAATAARHFSPSANAHLLSRIPRRKSQLKALKSVLPMLPTTPSTSLAPASAFFFVWKDNWQIWWLAHGGHTGWQAPIYLVSSRLH